MFRNTFRQFESPTRRKPTLSRQIDCTLNNSLFRTSIYWCIKSSQNIQTQKQSFQQLAKQFDVILCVWRVFTEKCENFNIIEVKSIQDTDKLPQFLTKALQVSKAIFMRDRFSLLSICMINKFGSFEVEKCSSVCRDCGQGQRLSECCGQFICSKCFKKKELRSLSTKPCPLCGKKLQLLVIPLQMVESLQSQYIYQPMLPSLSLEERFQLMDYVDAQLSYN